MEFVLQEPWLERGDRWLLDPYYGEREINQMITEANVVETGKNVFNAILTALKKALKWICDRIDNAVIWWSNRIQQRKAAVNPDDILEELKVQPNGNAVDAVPLKVEMVSADGTTQELVKNIKLESGPLRASVDPNNPDRVIIKVKDLAEFRNGPRPDHTVPHQARVYSTTDGAKACIVLMCHKNADTLRAKLTSIIAAMGTDQFMELYERDWSGVRMMLSDPGGSFYPGENSTKEFSLVDMKVFQRWMKEMYGVVMKLDEDIFQGDVSGNKEVMDAYNNVSGMIGVLQFGVNWLLGAIGGHQVISSEFAGIINTFEMMAAFVNHMIRQGMATKYIMYNVVAAASDNIKGDVEQKPARCGQSRITLFPADEKVVYKFALSQEGLRVNHMEAKISEIPGMAQYVCPIQKLTEDHAGVVMTRCDTTNHPGEKIVDELKQGMQTIMQQNGLHVDPTMDVWSHNCGYLDGRPVTYDYGALEYTAQKS